MRLYCGPEGLIEEAGLDVFGLERVPGLVLLRSYGGANGIDLGGRTIPCWVITSGRGSVRLLVYWGQGILLSGPLLMIFFNVAVSELPVSGAASW